MARAGILPLPEGRRPPEQGVGGLAWVPGTAQVGVAMVPGLGHPRETLCSTREKTGLGPGCPVE